ncbi:TPA: conjugal transfer protein TraM [Legionella pneumophila]|nr:conjugal transfer protein TraM [Legionella pneumophila]
MSGKFDEAIQEIAIKHGVVLSKDDPILMLQTMNERLIEESRQAQAVMLAQFREEIESISSQWKDDSKDKAEKILNAALIAHKEIATKLLSECTGQYVLAMNKVISDTLTEFYDLADQMRKLKGFTVLSSVTIFITVVCLFCFLY